MLRRCSGEVLLMSLMVLAAAGELAAQDCPHPAGHVGSGPARAVAAGGSRAYVGAGVVLQVVDLSTPANPILLGEVSLPDLIDAVAVSGDHVYVADRSSGLRVVDVSSPSAPVEVGSIVTEGTAEWVVVAASLAFLAADYGGVRVIDISNPSAPVEIGSYARGTHGVAVAGSYAYVGSASRLLVVDVSNPSSPVEVGSCELSEWASGPIVLSGPVAQLLTYSGALLVVDVSVPSAPVQVGSLGMSDGAEALAAAGPLTFIAGGQTGLHVVDVSTPSAPVEIGALDTPGYAVDVALAGSHLLVADWEEGLRVAGISDPTTPTEIGFLKYRWGGCGVYAVRVAGPYAYLKTQNPGVHVVDVSNPNEPVGVSSFSDLPLSGGFTVVGPHLFAAAMDAGLRIYDIADPTAPSDLGSYVPPGETYGVACAGDYAYVTGSFGLRVVDVSDPSVPEEVGHCDTLGPAGPVAVSGSHAYVRSEPGIRVVDIADPAAPVEVGLYAAPEGGLPYCALGQLAVAGRIAYLTSYCWDLLTGVFSTLHLVDVSDPTAPARVGGTTDCYGYGSLGLAGSVLYLGSQCGIRALDVSDPSTILEIGFHEARDPVEAFPSGVAVAGGRLYLADRRAGLDVMTGCHLFVDGFEIGTTATWGVTTP